MLGHMLTYTLTAQDAEQVNRRRNDARAHIVAGTVGNTGFVLHIGNSVDAGDEYPLIVTRVWPDGKINGQVWLDGNDSLWVTSVTP